MNSLKAGILGATGAVGQKFIRLLENHPWFKITALGASGRSAGKPYRKAANWVEPVPLPESIAGLEVRECKTTNFDDVDFVFSGLDSSVAGKIEKEFAASGIPVISNAKNFRMHPDVPLLVPEVNPDHIDLIDRQEFSGDGGWIVTNPNCVVIPLVMSLSPLEKVYGVESVILTSMQAISGAGYPGVPSLDILGNVLPFIPGEEPKIESEPLKLLGTLEEGKVRDAGFSIRATATRVPVRNGHLLSVNASLTHKPSGLEEVIDLFENWQSPLAEHDLPSAPSRPLWMHKNNDHPQPLLHAEEEKAMRTSIGRVRVDDNGTVSFVAMAHNTVRGAAGGAILNAELLVAKGKLTPAAERSPG